MQDTILAAGRVGASKGIQPTQSNSEWRRSQVGRSVTLVKYYNRSVFIKRTEGSKGSKVCIAFDQRSELQRLDVNQGAQ